MAFGNVEIHEGYLVYVNREMSGLLVIDEEVIAVDSLAGSALSAVYIPAMVEQINDGAFENSAIESVRFFGNKLTRIGDEVFKDCENLKEVNIPESVEIIDEYSFYNCISLEKITLSSSMTKLYFHSFHNSIIYRL